MSYLEALIPIICLAINVAVQVAVCRFVPPVGVLRSVILGFAFGFVGFLTLEAYAGSHATEQGRGYALANFITYIALGYCYFHFINLGETARRIRILRELYESGKGLTLSGILERYSAREVVRLRIDRLLSNGQLVYNNGRYFIGKPVVLMIAKSMMALKLLILGKRSEFD